MKTFVKSSAKPTNTFFEEAHGLTALSAVGKIRIAKMISHDETSITLERIETDTPDKSFWERFGRELAGFHSRTHNHFGFEIDNHIGATPQPNPKIPVSEITWAEYFFEHRLNYMVHHSRLKSETLLHKKFDQAAPKIKSLLAQVKEKPTLLHGDLWNGNFLCAQGQVPVLIDPAPYCGHREADLAMTELFGGFPKEFYQSYDKHLPLEPGYENRKHVYNLYHLLNHWIIFGSSYSDQALSVLDRAINLK